MRHRVQLLATTSLVVAIFAGTAHAQSSNSNTIEELVITAEKREQSLQDVPVAVTAFTSEKRDLIGVNTIADMTNFTPGLSYSTQLDRTTLRGVGRNTNVHAADGSVAIYNDGIYTSSTVLAGAKGPIFTDRVEVLRGPQGTLYGRNSIGGAINILSKRPTEDPYAEVRATYANYNRSLLEFAASGPTPIPNVNYRIAGNWDKQTKGWIENIVPGVPDEGNIVDTKVLEGQLQFKFNDNFEGWFTLTGINWDNGGGGPGSRGTWAPTPYATYYSGNAAIVSNPGYACRPGAPVTAVVNANPLGCVNPAINDPRKIANAVPYKVALRDTFVFASEWVYHLDTMDLKYLAGGTKYHYYLTGPTPADAVAPVTSYTLTSSIAGTVVAGIPINPRYGFDYQEDERWFSHELNLSSTGDGALQWLLGLYTFHETYNQPVFTTMFDQAQVAGPYLSAGPLCNLTGGACAPNPLRRIYDDRPHLDIKSNAVFGQLDWKMTDTLKGTFGLRYSEDHKYGYEAVRLGCFGPAGCAGNFGIIDLTQPNAGVVGNPAASALKKGVVSVNSYDPATGAATRKYDYTWSAVTGTLGIQWEPDADTNAYARYSRGYKGGGFRIGIDTSLGLEPTTDAEHVDAFEIGFKKTFTGLNLQTNMALFYYNYKDAQVPLNVAQTSGGLGQSNAIFYNIPEAISQGFELETIWQPIDNLQILFNYSYNDAHISESIGTIDPADPAALDPQARPIISAALCYNTATYGQVAGDPTKPTATTSCAADVFTSPYPSAANKLVPGAPSLSATPTPNGGYQRGQNLSGNQLPNAAKNKIALNVNYSWQLENSRLIGSISYLWRDEAYGSIFNRSYTKSPSWDQIDARVAWKPDGDKLTVILWGKNLADTLGYEGGAGAGRKAGATPGDLRPNSVEGIATAYPLTPPRTYGIELQYKFY